MRVEHRSANSKLIECEWSIGGSVKFDSIDDTSFATQSYATTLTTASFKTISGPLCNVEFDSCKLMGRHEYGYATLSVLYHQNLAYNNCYIRNFDEARDFLVITNQNATPNIGGAPMVTFEKTTTNASGASRYVFVDTDHNWHQNAASRLVKRHAMIKKPSAAGPSSGDTTVSVKLPLNAVITKVHFYQTPGGSSTQTNWSYTLRTTDATPVTIASVSGGGTTQLQAGFSQHNDTWFVCNTLARRQIDLVANASVDQDSTTFQCIVEYIG